MSNQKSMKLPEERPDPGTDREEGLSNSFEDPGIEELLPDLKLASQEGILEEAAEAVQELVLDASVPAAETFTQEMDLLQVIEGGKPGAEIQPGLDLSAEANQIQVEESQQEQALLVARAEMASRMFQLVACEKSFGALVEEMLRSVMFALSAQAGSVLEFDREKGDFFFRASAGGGDPEKLGAFRIPANKGIVGHVAESRQAVLLKSMDTDERQLLAVSMSTGFETKTCLAAPIVLDNQLYGVVELFNKISGDQFDEKDQMVLEEAVRMMGKILEVRFLLAELVRRLR